MEQREPAPFSDDPIAVARREACDYSIRITREMAESGTAPRPVRVYADGVYDAFHIGHAQQLQQAKNAFPNTYLIVGVTNDEDTIKHKGKLVMNENERYELMRHCRYADEVVKAHPFGAAKVAAMVEKHKVDFIAHDELPYATAGDEDQYKQFKDKGMFLATKRMEGVSTTDMVTRIVRDHEEYVKRNIYRGTNRQDLNISFFTELKVRSKVQLQSMLTEMSERSQSIVQALTSIPHGIFHAIVGGSHDRKENFENSPDDDQVQQHNTSLTVDETLTQAGATDLATK